MNQQYLNTRDMKVHLSELISDGYKSFSDLPEDDKELLTAYYIAQDKDRTEFLSNSNLYDEVMNLFVEYMRSSNKEMLYMMANRMKDAAIQYYEECLDEIYEEARCEEQNYKYEGLRKIVHKDNGDVTWVKP